MHRFFAAKRLKKLLPQQNVLGAQLGDVRVGQSYEFLLTLYRLYFWSDIVAVCSKVNRITLRRSHGGVDEAFRVPYSKLLRWWVSCVRKQQSCWISRIVFFGHYFLLSLPLLDQQASSIWRVSPPCRCAAAARRVEGA